MPEDITTTENLVKKFCWRQGSLIPQALVHRMREDSVIPFTLGELDRLIVISQDCDVCHDSMEVEPTVEVMKITPAERDGGLFCGKSSRRYQFEVVSGEMPVVYEASILTRFVIPRTYLTVCGPDPFEIAPRDIREIALWISRRYFREAFPDEFNSRIKTVLPKLRKKMKSHSNAITGIYLRLEDSELPAERPYKLIIRATVKGNAWEVPAKRTLAYALLGEIEAAFGKCKGIEVVDAKVVSEAEFSLAYLREFKLWDLSSITLREGEIEDLPPTA